MQVAVRHGERRHRFRGVSERQKGRMEEGRSDAGSVAQPAIQRSPGAGGWIADLRTARSLWVSCSAHQAETLIFGADAAFGFAQMFWDSTTLTASSKLKESASPLKCCCPTTCLLRRPVEGFKEHARAEHSGHPEPWRRVRSAAAPERDLRNLIYIYMLVNVASLM